jgi:hypothetical protein
VARQEAGRFENGKWTPTRLLGGDDSVLRYDIGRQAELHQSGTGVKLPAGKCGIQRVEVYRYQ